MSRAVRFRVSGRVQGVSFRAFTRETATGLDLAGWVRNEPDGTVSGFAQGTPEAVQRLLLALHEGPAAARVADLAVTEADPTSTAPRPFSIHY